MLMLASAAPGQTAPAPDDARPSPAALKTAARTGAAWLLARQQDDGSFPSEFRAKHPGGPTSLATLALLESGVAPGHEAVVAAVKYLRDSEAPTVYARALRTLVWAELRTRARRAGKVDEQLRRALTADAAWLVRQQQTSGGWGYGPTYPVKGDWTDTSNSQLAMLALHRADLAGVEVPEAVWRRALNFWTRGQNADGGWGYTLPGGAGIRVKGSSYGAMTAAGVASTLMLIGRLSDAEALFDETSPRGVPRELTEPVDDGLAWLAANYSIRAHPKYDWGAATEWLGVYWFCLARAAGGTGQREIGDHPWRRELARAILATQQDSGAWPVVEGEGDAARRRDDLHRTAFVLLSLARVNRPVLLTRLSLAERWTPPARDAANLARWYSVHAGPTVSWVRAGSDASAEDLARAPLAYLPLSGRTAISKDLSGALRKFLLSGGLLFVQAGKDNTDLARRLHAYFLELLPELRAVNLSADHPVYTRPFMLPADARAGLLAVGDALRTAVLIAATDHATRWNAAAGGDATAFRFGANLAAYAAGPDRLRSPFATSSLRRADPPRPAVAELKVARLVHDGDWRICPRAIPRLSDTLAAALSIRVKEAKGLDATAEGDVPLVWATGARAGTLSDARKQALKAYLAGGGTLFADSVDGKGRFTEGLAGTLREMFGDGSIRDLPADSPLLTGRFGGGVGSSVTPVETNAALAKLAPDLKVPPLKVLVLKGRVAAVLSPFSVTCPLAGRKITELPAYSPDTARRLAANVLLFAADRKRRPQTR